MQRDRLRNFFGKVNQYSGLTNVPKLRIIKQVTGFGGRPPVHKFQDKIGNKKIGNKKYENCK